MKIKSSLGGIPLKSIAYKLTLLFITILSCLFYSPVVLGLSNNNDFINSILQIKIITEEQSNIINFSDENLENAVRAAINKPQGNIYVSDVQSLVELTLTHKNISNLEGI